MIPSASPRQRSRERGEFSWVTLLLLTSLLGGGYLAVVWGPVYLVRYEAGVVANEFANKAVHNHDDAALVQGLCAKLAGLDQVKFPEPDGSTSVVPAVDVRPEDVTWDRNAAATPPTIRVAFTYTTSVYYPFIDRFTEKTFSIERSQDIQPAKW
jgi:hypothetical protein